jgi:fatty acid desaturase
MGVGQHRLIMLGHEASHYLLFRNRVLNDLASDWFCMFPLLSLTHNYRLQHLAHHQYVNHPANDPDLIFMRAVGHCYQVLMPRLRFLGRCVVRRLLWVPGLVRYVRVRARYTATGTGGGPYQGKRPRSRLLIAVGAGYIFATFAVMTALAMVGNPWLLAVVPALLYAAVALFYLLVPERLYVKTLVRPEVAPRWSALLRLGYLTGLFAGLGWLSYLTERPWGLYYLLLWIAPLVTTFAICMILREEVQHGEGTDRGRFTSTRLFRGNPLIRWAVFPLGMDYHLPHHLFPLVPHYRLKALHRMLLEVEEYRHDTRVVEGYLFPRERRA